MSRRPLHYAMSTYAYTNLTTDSKLFYREPAKYTQYLHTPQPMYNQFGGGIEYTTDADSTHTQGLSWSLTILARSADYYDWFLNPAKPITQLEPGYIPQDLRYIKDMREDNGPYDTWSSFDKTEYAHQQSLAHRARSLTLDDYTRSYYSNLLVYLHLQLPTGRPCIDNPLMYTHADNLTTRVSFCLEAIGCGFILPPMDAPSIIATPNPARQKHHRASKLRKQAGDRMYGNHSHEPYEPKVWRTLPSSLSTWTQQDVDYACMSHVRLADIAQEVVALNPNLTMPIPVEGSPTYSTTPTSPTTPQTTLHAKARQTIERVLVPTTFNNADPHELQSQPVYRYKGRNVTKAILETYPLYLKGMPFTTIVNLPAANNIPYQMLRNLILRHHIYLTETIPCGSPDQGPLVTSPVATSTQLGATNAS